MKRLVFSLTVGAYILGASGEGLAVRHWAVEPMSDVMRLPDKVPTDGIESGVVRIVMAKGEYEPGSFVVQAAKDLGKVKFELGEFKQVEKAGAGGGAVLPKDALDLKFVKVWYQNRNSWYCYFGDNGRTLCPELLVNDEDLIRCDHERKFNFAKLVEPDGRVHEQWIDPPYQFDNRNAGDYSAYHVQTFEPMKRNFRDAKTLQPVALPKGECKQFFLTVHTTPDTPEGLYRGEVAMRGGSGRRIGLIPVEIRVLPFVLPRPKTYVRPEEDFWVASYNYIDWQLIKQYNGYDQELMYAQYEEILRNALRHGQDVHWVRANVADTNRPEQVREALWTVDLMNRVGMRTDILLGGSGPTVKTWGRKEFPPLAEWQTNAAEVVKLTDAAFGHHNVYMGFGDEPSPQWLREKRPAFLAFQDVGMKFILASWGAIFAVNPFAMDWQNIGGSPEGGVELANKWNQLGMRTAWYAGHHVGPENPAFCRRQYGFSPYFGGYSAVCNYAHHLGPYNDNSPKYRPMVNAYGTGDGVLDTLQWEGFREGIDDIRYATVLKKLADRGLKSADGAVRRTARKALAMFANYKMESEDLSRLRSRIVDYILVLREKVGDVEPDRPLARAKVATVPAAAPAKSGRPDNRTFRADYAAGRFDAACDYYMNLATNNRERVFSCRGAWENRLGLYSAYLGGRAELLQAIADGVERKAKNFKTNELYEVRFAVAAFASADRGGAEMSDAWTAADERFRAGVDDKARLEAIDRVGQVLARKFGPDRVMAFWDWRESRLKPTPRKHYRVAWSERPVQPELWDELKLEESVFDRKWKGSFDFLTTDVSTGNRGVGAAGVADGQAGCVTMSAVADGWGLHFRFTDRTDEAKLIGMGAKGDGSYECYLAPGLRAPYSCAIADVSRNGGVSTWNTTYNTAGWRRLDGQDRRQIRVSNICRDDRVETFISFAWSTYFNRIPDGSEPWEFESLRWGRHNSAWNGTHYVHGRSTWGFLDIPLKPSERAAIFRSLLLEAKNDFSVGDTAAYWQDPELGDPVFYEEVVKGELEKVEAWKKRIVPEMDDKAALELGVTALPAIRDFGYTIDRLRTRYAADLLSKE